MAQVLGQVPRTQRWIYDTVHPFLSTETHVLAKEHYQQMQRGIIRAVSKQEAQMLAQNLEGTRSGAAQCSGAGSNPETCSKCRIQVLLQTS